MNTTVNKNKISLYDYPHHHRLRELVIQECAKREIEGHPPHTAHDSSVIDFFNAEFSPNGYTAKIAKTLIQLIIQQYAYEHKTQDVYINTYGASSSTDLGLRMARGLKLHDEDLWPTLKPINSNKPIVEDNTLTLSDLYFDWSGVSELIYTDDWAYSLFTPNYHTFVFRFDISHLFIHAEVINVSPVTDKDLWTVGALYDENRSWMEKFQTIYQSFVDRMRLSSSLL